MAKHEVYYVALLANVDQSILNVALENSLKIRADSIVNIVNGKSELSVHFQNMDYHEVFRMMSDLGCIDNDQMIYYVGFKTDDYIEINDDGITTNIVQHDRSATNEAYLHNTLRLMRLFKEGNIYTPYYEFYYFHEGEKRKHLYTGTIGHINREAFRVEKEELEQLQTFIKETRLPFQARVELAFDNYELSYIVNDINLSFLALMISTEILLSPVDMSELSNRVSRNTAILLGRDREEGNSIYREMKDLYKKRSKLVHAGKPVSLDDVKRVRFFVQELIKVFININNGHKEFLLLLETCGFGEKLWRDSLT